jgi:hypothetical protein
VIQTIIAAITSSSLAGVLYGECVLVPPLESSSHVRIYVALKGKPLKGAMVIFLPSRACACASDALRGNPLDTDKVPSGAFQITDENGIATLPELAPGEYDVAATLNGVASTVFIGLHVNHRPEVTTLPMDLTEQVQRLETAPIQYRVEAFQGTVQDPSGVTLPGARIVVVKRGSPEKDVVLRGKADANGHFSGQLAEGSYLAVFFSRGFRPAIAPFNLVRGGSSELSVSLKIGGCP